MTKQHSEHLGSEPGVFVATLGSQVMIQFPESRARHRGVLVGSEEAEYLMIRLLDSERLPGPAPKGSAVIAGCVQLGTVYAFEVQVIDHLLEPFPLLFLTYPDRFQTHTLRGSVRVSSNLPARAQLAGRDLRGRVVDLGAGGCRFVLRIPEGPEELEVRPGDPLSLSFVLFGGYGEQTVSGGVRAVHRRAGRIVLGVQFDRMDAAIQEKIETYVRGVVEFHRGRAA